MDMENTTMKTKDGKTFYHSKATLNPIAIKMMPAIILDPKLYNNSIV